MDQNPDFELYDVSHICNVPRIASIDNMLSINTAIAIDLNGQAVISHLGPTPISGPGGQVEYTIGSHYSKGGRCFLTLLSTAKGGTVSRIVPQLVPGSVVLIPNIYVDYLVTEHGIVNLECKSDRERAEAIISVAHPDFQPDLRKAARKMFYP
jgi:4-hydroxybutyrate CoA-transferase